jgi:putative flippase GtrA
LAVRTVSTHIQFSRYAVVGLASNLLLYMLYLLMTSFGLGHKTAATVLYLMGTLVTFAFNRGWTFSHAGSVSPALIRYFLVYVGGYLVNLGSLYLLVDRFGMPHQAVQAALILIIAVGLFTAHKLWVFRHRDTEVDGVIKQVP